MAQHRSINQRLNRAKVGAVKLEIANEWVHEWDLETLGLFSKLEQAIKSDDYDLLCKWTGQLKAVHLKRMQALPKVLLKLSELSQEQCPSVIQDNHAK